MYKALGITGQTVLLLSAVYGTVGFTANCISVRHEPFLTLSTFLPEFVQIRFVDKVGRVTMLKIALPSLVGLLIYSAIMAHFFNSGDNQVGKGFAILGIYLYTFMYCTPLPIYLAGTAY